MTIAPPFGGVGGSWGAVAQAVVNEILEQGLLPTTYGPPGPTGPPGGVTYLHTQAVPAAEWVVDHNLNLRPLAIIVKDSAHTEVLPEVFFETVNRIRLRFGAAMGGEARVIA